MDLRNKKILAIAVNEDEVAEIRKGQVSVKKLAINEYWQMVLVDDERLSFQQSAVLDFITGLSKSVDSKDFWEQARREYEGKFKEYDYIHFMLGRDNDETLLIAKFDGVVFNHGFEVKIGEVMT